MRTLVLTLCSLLWCSPSLAQSRCAPLLPSPAYTSELVAMSVTDADGPWIIWSCTSRPLEGAPDPTKVTRSYHCRENEGWTGFDLRRLGDRADTVRKAADPQAAWQVADKRYTLKKTARCAEWLRLLTS